jgi:hypothetical protein
VVGIIEPDGDEIADAADASADARLALHQRQLFRLELAQLVQARGRQRCTRDVGDHLRQVADAAFLIDHAGLFAAGRAIANEFHDLSP